MHTVAKASDALDQVVANERTNLITIPAQMNLALLKHPTQIPVHSVRSFALASVVVCHSMLSGVSLPPCLSALV